jgi:hypothetical protein
MRTGGRDGHHHHCPVDDRRSDHADMDARASARRVAVVTSARCDRSERRWRGRALDPAKGIAQLQVLDRFGAIRARAVGASRLSRASDRVSRADHRTRASRRRGRAHRRYVDPGAPRPRPGHRPSQSEGDGRGVTWPARRLRCW